MGEKPKTTKEIINKFIVKELTQIEGDLNYAAINKLIQVLYGNVATFPTTLGVGRNGHVWLITKDTLYATLFQTVWVTSHDPGAGLFVPETANTAQRQQLWDEHDEKRRIYKKDVKPKTRHEHLTHMTNAINNKKYAQE